MPHHYTPAVNSPEEIDRLCQQWERWAYKVMQRYVARLPKEMLRMAGGVEEFEAIARQALFACARLFEAGRVGKHGQPCESMGTPLNTAVWRMCQQHVERTGRPPYEIPVVFLTHGDPGDETHPEPYAREERDRDPETEAAAVLAMQTELTAKQRKALELHYFEGLTWREISLRDGKSKTNGQSVVRNALRKLRQAFGVVHKPGTRLGLGQRVWRAFGKRPLTVREVTYKAGFKDLDEEREVVRKTVARLVKSGKLTVANPGHKPLKYVKK